jgi:hypothetical protein
MVRKLSIPLKKTNESARAMAQQRERALAKAVFVTWWPRSVLWLSKMGFVLLEIPLVCTRTHLLKLKRFSM